MALRAIKGKLTSAELSARHGVHQTMLAAWKRQVIEGLASTFSGEAEAVQASGEAELTRLHARSGQLVVERDFLEGLRSMRPQARDDRGMPSGESKPTVALMRLIEEAFLDCPYYGSRQVMRHLHRLAIVLAANGLSG